MTLYMGAISKSNPFTTNFNSWAKKLSVENVILIREKNAGCTLFTKIHDIMTDMHKSTQNMII